MSQGCQTTGHPRNNERAKQDGKCTVSLNLARGASHYVGREPARALNEAVTHITVEDYLP
jgi:hypothetical protein